MAIPTSESVLRMLVRRFVRAASGENLIEYLLLGAFIAVVTLAGLGSLGTSTNGWYAVVATFVGGDDTGAEGGGSGSKSNCSAMGALKSGGKCQ